MEPFTQQELDEKVREAVRTLARLLPRHIASVSEEPAGDGRRFTLANPYDHDRPLIIETADREITVAFGESHNHYWAGMGFDLAELVGEMAVQIVHIVSGVELSYSRWAGDRRLGGGTFWAEGNPRPELDRFEGADRLKIVGWEPPHDAEERREPA